MLFSHKIICVFGGQCFIALIRIKVPVTLFKLLGITCKTPQFDGHLETVI